MHFFKSLSPFCRSENAYKASSKGYPRRLLTHIPLSEEKAAVRKYRMEDKKVALDKPTVLKPPPPPPTLKRFIQNARLPESDSDSSIDGFYLS